MNVLITGANGFVGTALCRRLRASGATVFGTVRSEKAAAQLIDGVQPVVMSLENLSPLESLAGRCECIVHLAARVHQMKESSADPRDEYFAVNTHATENLARWGATHGVRRFVSLSSIKVNGEGQDFETRPHIYSEQDIPAPQDVYGVSKWEAEQALHRISRETGLESVILRPTLIYGPQVRANFLQLMRLVKSGLPLPLSRISNARSLLFVENLTDAIQVCLSDPRAAGETFLVSDGEDVSTPDLIRMLAECLRCPARLFPVSPSWLQGLGKVSGKSAAVQRLLGTLQVDSRRIREVLHWQPPFTLHQGLQATCNWYLGRSSSAPNEKSAA